MLGRTLGKNDSFDDSKMIEDTIRRALEDRDLSKLKSLGPIAQRALNDLIFGSRPGNNPPRSVSQSPSQANRGYSVPSSLSSSQYPSYQTGSYQAAPSPLYSNSSGGIKRQRIPRGIPQIIFGAAGVLVFGIAALLFSAVLMTLAEPVLFAIGAILAAGCAVVALLSAWPLAVGIKKYRLADRATQLANLLQRKPAYTFDELAAETNRNPKQIKRDVRKIQEKNLLAEIFTDPDGKYVMWGRDTYEQYLQQKEAHLQKVREEEGRRLRLSNPATADIEQFRKDGAEIIQKIRAANDAIPGEEFSTKLDTLEDTVARIFLYVERYPEKLPDTRKFMNHYLPTTLKLVEKYHQYDGMDFEPQNVRQAKAEIERSMDTINRAFNNLLESLFARDTLDVATDIDVLEKMLEQEGLTGDTFKIDRPG
jgi:5-bromo-4-chloroindolyl phosphate hydrolysis protein